MEAEASRGANPQTVTINDSGHWACVVNQIVTGVSVVGTREPTLLPRRQTWLRRYQLSLRPC